MGPRELSRGWVAANAPTAEYRMASMGPRELSRGWGQVSGPDDVAHSASMGPRELSRGWGAPGWCATRQRPASMGPRELSRGWVREGSSVRKWARELQWGRGSCPADGSRCSRERSMALAHFNGAAGVVPRMGGYRRALCARRGATSMGPRELSRGWPRSIGSTLIP